MPGFTVTTELSRIDLDLVHQWLSTDAFGFAPLPEPSRWMIRFGEA